MPRGDRLLETIYLTTRAVGTASSDVAVHDKAALAWQRERWFNDLGPAGLVVALDRKPMNAALRELDEVYSERSEANWDGYGASAVHHLTYEKAQEFLNNLPSAVGSPEIGADPDGEIVLEWFRSSSRLLSISLALNGRLTYIYRNGATRMRGTFWFLDDEVPQELIKLLEVLRA